MDRQANPISRLWRHPENLLLTTFALLIAFGTAFLMMPASRAATAPSLSFLDGLFTATSAVCVTGLVTRDTATEFSRFGQTVILVLIQLGGLGVMTFGVVAAQLMLRQVSFTSQAALRGVFFDGYRAADLNRALRNIVLLTLIVELLGAIGIRYGLNRGGGPAGGWFEATFLSVSAFCNAGFSIYSDSLMSFSADSPGLYVIMLLIVLGGLGYAVLFELLARGRRLVRRRSVGPLGWTLQSRVVLLSSAALILGGTLALLALERGDCERTVPRQLLDALFQSITARTAGFNTVDIGRLSLPALMIIMLLMFVGGSPGSCAGGVKTTTTVAWAASVLARIRGQADVNILERRLPSETVRRAELVVSLAILWNAFGILLLVVTERAGTSVSLDRVIFEQLSAFCTVGLSAGMTSELSVAGKLWIIASMFVGRLGSLTVMVAILKEKQLPYRYPADRVMVG